MAQPVKRVSTLIKRMLEFYEEHGWGRNALRTYGDHWCVLGAASAVQSNQSIIERAADNSIGYPDRSWKGFQTINQFEHVFEIATGWNPAAFNDREGMTKRKMISALRKTLKLAESKRL